MPSSRHEQLRRDVEVRRREAERAAALVAHDDDALDLRRPPEELRRMRDVAGGEQLPDVARRHALDERDRAARRSRAARAGRGRPPRPGRSGTRRPRRRPRRRSRAGPSRRSLRLERGERLVEVERRATSSTPASASSSSRRSSVASSSHRHAEERARVRIEGHDRGRRPAARAASSTRRCPRWTPSNVPIATARRAGSSSSGRVATVMLAAPRAPRGEHVGLGEQVPRLEVARRDGVVDRERADFRAPQRHAVAAERRRDRAHVGAGADAQVERRPSSRCTR